MMSSEDRAILGRFAQQTRSRYLQADIRAFGSRARGAADSVSDLDVCIMLPEVNRDADRWVRNVAWERLATLNKGTTWHSGAIGLCDLHFVKTGTFPKEFSRWLHDAFDLRQRSDYIGKPTVILEDATEAVSNESAFVDRVGTVLQAQGGSPKT